MVMYYVWHIFDKQENGYLGTPASVDLAPERIHLMSTFRTVSFKLFNQNRSFPRIHMDSSFAIRPICVMHYRMLCWCPGRLV